MSLQLYYLLYRFKNLSIKINVLMSLNNPGQDLLRHCDHHSSNSRLSAVMGLRELWLHDYKEMMVPTNVQGYSAILKKLSSLLIDNEATVRHAVVNLFKVKASFVRLSKKFVVFSIFFFLIFYVKLVAVVTFHAEINGSKKGMEKFLLLQELLLEKYMILQFSSFSIIERCSGYCPVLNFFNFCPLLGYILA